MKSHFRYPRVDARMILKLIFKDLGFNDVAWFQLNQQWSVAGFCKHDNKHLVSIKCREFCRQLSNYQFSKDYSAAYS